MSRRVAVIGGGAAGLSAAFHLRAKCQVTLFEREPSLGGHACTFQVQDGPDAGLPLDVAFMVMNPQNYPKLYRLLAEVGSLKLGPSEMSFSYCCRESGEEYAINYDLLSLANGGIERQKTPAPPPLLRSLYPEIGRFCAQAARDAGGGETGEQELGAYLDERCISSRLRRYYIAPMAAALWSMPPGKVLNFPAALFLRFMENHGLLNLENGRSWQHILGGSRVYVQAVFEALSKTGTRLRLGTAVACITRRERGVAVETRDAGSEEFDAVVIATHADQALALLADAAEDEALLLGSFAYQDNLAVLHCDESVMPRDSRFWASWNYEREPGSEADCVCITYHLNRLQGYKYAARQYFLTLNRRAPIRAAKVLAQWRFAHPMFNRDALRAQACLRTRPSRLQTWFAGSYLGYGFHEDAVASGLCAASMAAAG